MRKSSRTIANVKRAKSDDSTLLFQGIEKEHGEKWVKYVINKNIENRRKKVLPSSTKSNLSATASQAFWTTVFSLCDLWLLSIKNEIFQLPLQAVCLRLFQRSVSFLELLIFPFYTLSQVFCFVIFVLIYKKKLKTNVFLTYLENNFCRLSFMLLNVSFT